MAKTELESGSLLHQYTFQVSGGTNIPLSQTFTACKRSHCSRSDPTVLRYGWDTVRNRNVCDAWVSPRLRMLRQTCVKQFMEGKLVKENAAICLPNQVYLSLSMGWLQNTELCLWENNPLMNIVFESWYPHCMLLRFLIFASHKDCYTLKDVMEYYYCSFTEIHLFLFIQVFIQLYWVKRSILRKLFKGSCWSKSDKGAGCFIPQTANKYFQQRVHFVPISSRSVFLKTLSFHGA